MKIDFSQKLFNRDGNQIKDANTKKDTTLGTTSVECLDVNDSQDGEDKFARSELAEEIHGKAVVDLSVDKVARIRELIGKYANPLLVGQCWKMIDKMDETKQSPSGDSDDKPKRK